MPRRPSTRASLDALGQLARLCATRPDWDRLAGPALRLLSDELGLDTPAVALRDPQTDAFGVDAAHGLTPAEIRRATYRPGEGLTGRVGQTGEPVLVEDVSREPAFLDRTGAGRRDGDRAFVCVPLWSAGAVVGTLSAFLAPAPLPELQRARGILETTAGLLSAAAARHVAAHAAAIPDEAAPAPDNLVGRSKAMKGVYAQIEQVAASSTTVLLQGESGTGKELVARALHKGSARSRRAFVAVNVAALSETLLESELFGHERGAFTGALQQRKGRFEVAHRGTLFLDEIGDLSLPNQVKLLRVLQERQIERVGGHQPIDVDVRLIAATSRDLEAMVAEGSFRQDLYWRLAVFPVRLPPLRERFGDVVPLADHFVEVFNRVHGREVRRISTPALDLLTQYHWPGNVRELENAVERGVLLARDGVLQSHHLPPSLQTASTSGTAPSQGLHAALGLVERELLMDALKSSKGNIAAAARALGVTERVMGLRMRKRGVDARRFKPTKA